DIKHVATRHLIKGIASQPSFQYSAGDLCIWQHVSDHIIEATEQRLVQQFGMIGGCDNQARAIVVLEELQKRIQNTANLAYIVRTRPLRADRVELVEEINPPLKRDRIENKPEASSCLPQELADQPLVQNSKQRELELAGDGRSGHRLARSRRADQ